MKKEFFKFVFLGAGSSVFTMRLVGDILKEDTIKKGHIALVHFRVRNLKLQHILTIKRRCRERIICLIRLQQEGTSVGRVT